MKKSRIVTSLLCLSLLTQSAWALADQWFLSADFFLNSQEVKISLEELGESGSVESGEPSRVDLSLDMKDMIENLWHDDFGPLLEPFYLASLLEEVGLRTIRVQTDVQRVSDTQTVRIVEPSEGPKRELGSQVAESLSYLEDKLTTEPSGVTVEGGKSVEATVRVLGEIRRAYDRAL